MPIPRNLTDLELAKYKEATSVANQVSVVVINPDGSDVASSITVNVTQDIISSLVDAEDSVDSNTAELLNVSGSNKTDRFVVTVQPLDGKLRWSIASGMTSSQGGFISKNTVKHFLVTDAVDIYVIATTGTVNYHVAEGS